MKLTKLLNEIQINKPNQQLSLDDFMDWFNELDIYYNKEIHNLIKKYGYKGQEGLQNFYNRLPNKEKHLLSKDLDVLIQKSKDNRLNINEE